MRKFDGLMVFALLLAAPATASAHGAGDHVHGFGAGLAHPLLGADHLLAMLAVGVLAARFRGAAVMALPLAFLAAMTAGATVGLFGWAPTATESAIALSLVALGAMILAHRAPPLAALAALTALFGAAHGLAHGLEVPETAGGLGYAAGFLAATAALHAAGTTVAVRLATGHRAVRLFGGLTALAGAAALLG